MYLNPSRQSSSLLSQGLHRDDRRSARILLMLNLLRNPLGEFYELSRETFDRPGPSYYVSLNGSEALIKIVCSNPIVSDFGS